MSEGNESVSELGREGAQEVERELARENCDQPNAVHP